MKYQYRARTPEGEVQTGTVEASSRESATNILQQKSLVVTELRLIPEEGIFGKQLKILPDKVKEEDLVFFFRQLSILFSADVSLVESLNALGKQSQNSELRDRIFKILRRVDAGTSFSAALKEHEEVFSTFVVNMVKIGETAGTLEKVLKYLADHIERNYRLTSKIKGSLLYPAFVVGAAFIVIVIMMLFVLPKMTEMFEDLNAELPLATQIIIGASDFFVAYWWLVFLILIGAGIFIWRFIKTDKGKRWKDRTEINLPILGEVFRNLNYARICENMGTLIRGGVPIVRALDTVSTVLGNVLYSEILENARDRVRKGGTVAEVFSESEIITPALSEMISSGEKTGQLGNILKKVSDFYTEEVNNAVDNLMRLLEPILIVALGIGVGFVAAAVLLPIYNLAGQM